MAAGSHDLNGAAGTPERAPDRTLRVVALAATVIAAADLVRVGLDGSGRWPWPLLWAPAALWAYWLHRRPDRRARAPALTHGPGAPVLTGAALALAAVAAVGIAFGLHRANPLVAHDEAVYANLARSWIGPLPASGFQPYRPPGISALGAVVLSAAGSADPDRQLVLLRGLAVLFTVAALAAMFLLGRAVTTPARAAVAVLVLAASATFERRSYQLMDDIPAATLLCLATWCLLRAMRTGRLPPLLLAVVAAMAAFYLRYGSLVAVLSLAVAAVAADGPRAWWARRGQVAAALAVALACLVPFAVYSVRATGSVVGLLGAARGVAGRTAPGDGLLHYVLWAPVRLLGDVGGPVLLAATAALVVALRRPVGDDRRRGTVLLAGAGLLQVVLLGLTAHAEERYVYFALMAGAVVGVDAIARVAGRYARPAVALLAVFAVLQLPASFWFERRAVGRVQDGAVAMAGAARQAGPPPCLAVGPRWGPATDPEVGWYSGCAVRVVAVARPPASCRTGLAVLVGTGADRDPRVERASSALLDRRRAACGAAPPSGPASFSGPDGHGIRLFRG